MDLSTADIKYAIGEAERLRETDGKILLEWEAELKRHSKRFLASLAEMIGRFIRLSGGSLSRAEDALAEFQRVRQILTYVYAASYSAGKKSLPKMTPKMIEDARITYSYFDFEQGLLLPAVVLRMINMCNSTWANSFAINLKENFKNEFLHYPVLILVKILLDQIDKEDYEDVFGDQEEKTPFIHHPAIVELYGIGQITKKEPKQKVTFDQVGGQAKAKLEITRLATALRNPAVYARWGTRPPRGICLCGPPGNGKTLLARALADESEVQFYNVDPAELLSKWWGEDEKNIAELFAKARRTGGVIFFDEIDALAPSRETAGINQGHYNDIIAALNRNLDGFLPLDKVVVFFATNRLEDLDKAVIRAGRIDRIIEVPLPEAAGRLEIFKIHVKNAEKIASQTLFQDIDFDALVGKTKEFSGADIAEIVRRVLEAKVREEEAGGSPTLVGTADILHEIGSYERQSAPKRQVGF